MMSSSIGFLQPQLSSSRIPSFPSSSVSGPTTISLSALRFHTISKPGSHSIQTQPPSTRIQCFAALSPQLKTTLDQVVTSHKVILFMKGTKDFPQCGFSNTVVSILKAVDVPFETVNILENEMLRQGLKEYSQWPTFPQLYIDGEFFGGCDITVDAYKSGELQELLERASLS
uniref:uncharacterized monothiol glutaredoxin ycf64-like n=1 Tax=Erigeron canadensis TaxID=72917 RepID=UPI001CB90EE8|nr:uncharacterized monothiol glutaredoxin ycf64-like [Erigeron canadensis]